MAASPDLGPQYPRDDRFTARMRLHQSWYRSAVLGLPCGLGPGARGPNRYGNMLTPEDGATGANFLSPGTFEYVQRRIAQRRGTVDEFRRLHNMLSSQPMCANLVGPLALDPTLATRVARRLWGDDIARVTRVELEWAPEPASEYLADRTAFDAFIEFELTSGGLGFVGIETKLTEPFSQKHYDSPAYRRWMTSPRPWRPDADTSVDAVRHNQLWRDHLLAWALLQHPHSPYTTGRLAVVYHPVDTSCASVLADYTALLDDTTTLHDLPLDRFIEAMRPEPALDVWCDAFHLRYLALERSAPAAG